jgi:thioredoxin reductase
MNQSDIVVIGASAAGLTAALTASPIAYQLVNAAEMAISAMKLRS